MGVRLLTKSKPNNYTESCMINEADRWRGRNVWYPGAGRLERRHDTDKPKREGLQNKYLPIDKTGANLFFQLIAKRYEHNSTIITTNQPFSKWADAFSDAIYNKYYVPLRNNLGDEE